MANEDFADFEKRSFTQFAASYDDIVLGLTAQTFPPIMAALGELAGMAILELACGTGHFAAELATGGAEIIATDFSDGMIEKARQLAPGVDFRVADALDLPFADSSFDAVICTFGYLHMADPAKAFAESARVLRPGGQLIFTLWADPEVEFGFLTHVNQIYAELADANAGLPDGPPMFLLAGDEPRNSMLLEAGFERITQHIVPVAMPVETNEAIFNFVNRSIRVGMLYRAQPPAVQSQIKQALLDVAQQIIDTGEKTVPSPALMVVAYRAA